jgi:NAD(P)H-dependent flavin oxidoreductase YrpB (nitropropane dioxygenase family)
VVDVKREFMPAGQGVGAITSLKPAAQIVREIVADAESFLRGTQKYFA